MGSPPNIQDLYDPTSKKHILAGTFPIKAALQRSLIDLEHVFLRYGITVLRPDNVVDCNQIFARDLGFVVDDIFVRANIIQHREKELAGLTSLLAGLATRPSYLFWKRSCCTYRETNFPICRQYVSTFSSRR
jgi:hypothetical protein